MVDWLNLSYWNIIKIVLPKNLDLIKLIKDKF